MAREKGRGSTFRAEAIKLFRRAVELPADERDQHLDRVCADDSELRSLVEGLLRDHVDRELGLESVTHVRSAPKTESDTVIGRVINGEYEVLSEIGSGGFGTVYRCREVTLGKIVAIKMFSRDLARGDTLSGFIEEGRKLAVLDHPNVVQVHRAGEFDGRPYLVMECLEGRTLRDLVQETSFTLSRALDVMAQAARGLHAIHLQGIVHRDLSARNVMVTREGTTKILDLGLARFVDATATLGWSKKIAGTLLYLAPEVIDGSPPSYSADIFAFGVLLYESVSGSNPFRAESSTAVIRKILTLDPEPIARLVPGAPPRLARLIDHCLEKDPKDRLSSLEGVPDQVLRCALESSEESHGRIPQHVHDAQPNPYLNRGTIRRRGDFFGRAAEVRRIFARLNATPPGSVSIVGDRRIGKSSLLSYISMRVNRDVHLEHSDAMILVMIDLQQHRGITLETFLKEIAGHVKKELDGRLELSAVPSNLDGMKRMVQELSDAGHRLALLLDEFEVITTNENFPLEFFSFLRFLANHFDVVYITSSVCDLQELCHTKEIADSPFFNIFTTMRLGSLKPEEAQELVLQPSRLIGVDLAPYRDFVFDELAGHLPIFIQIACSHLVETIQEHPEAGPDLEEVGRLFVQEAETHFRYLWESFEEYERTVIRKVVRERSVPDSLRDVMRELETRGYLRTKDGVTRTFSESFANFVRKTERKADGGSLWTRLLARVRAK